jgi:hypothetical protein
LLVEGEDPVGVGVAVLAAQTVEQLDRLAAAGQDRQLVGQDPT